MPEEEQTEPPRPSAERVARRAIVLSVVSCRGFVEHDTANPKGAADLAKRSFDWIKSLGLDNELNSWERRLLESPFGTIGQQERFNAGWLSEAATILAWSLGRISLPGAEEQCDPAGSANSLGFLQPTEATVLNAPRLRPSEELREYNEFIYNVHWRLRDFQSIRKPYDFEALARKAWGEPVSRHGLVFKEKDLCVHGVPLSLAEETACRAMSSNTQERHRASNWLVGYASEDFYEVTTDT